MFRKAVNCKMWWLIDIENKERTYLFYCQPRFHVSNIFEKKKNTKNTESYYFKIAIK